MERGGFWLALLALSVFIAARGGNWLISRASIGASETQLVFTWLQIFGGLGVGYWAWRRMKSMKSGQNGSS